MAARGSQTVAVKPKNTRKALARLLSYVSEYKAILLLALLLSFVGNIAGLIGPGMAGSAIDAASAGAGKVDMNAVWYYAKRMLLCYLFSSATGIGVSILMMSVSKNIAQNMRRDVFDKMMKLPVGYFDTNSTGDIISRVSYDVDVVCTSLSTDIVQIMTSIVTVLGALFMMMKISLRLSVVVIITLPVSIGYTVWMRKKTQPRYSRRSKAYGDMNGFVEEMFSGQKTIQAYAYESTVEQGFEAVNSEAAEANRDAEFYGSTMGPTMSMINNITLGLIAALGSALYIMKLVSLGQISSFVLYSRKFSGPVNEIAGVMNEIYSALSASERIFALIDETEEPADDPDAMVLENVKGDVELKHVSFGYTPDKTVLHDLSLKADAEKLIAIVGPTGSGKSTIINLLMRFYEINSGEILVDGVNIKNITRDSLRRAYAMVLQETWVFNGTVFDNIAYGKENATKAEVVRAAKAAHIHSFIMQLPKGYQTVIGEDGGNISKGQKQLLTIARAMLYDSNMLILDEATSNVDTDTEREIQAAMRSLMSDKTCFVIAHRLSTIQNADRILVVNHGDVIEQGTHDSLMAQKGFYYDLYSAQFE